MQQAKVFISYARRDGLDHAERLEEALNQAGIPTWRDKRGLDPWQDFTSQIEDAINEASHVVVCLTPDSKRDDSFVRREIQAALLHKPVKPIITLRFAEIPPHIHINTLSWIDCFREWDSALRQFLEWLKRPVMPQQPAPKPNDPFRRYVEHLNELSVQLLRRTVFNAQVIALQGRDTPEAVKAAYTNSYLSRLPSWFADDAPPQSFANFHEAFEHHQRRLLLLGEPGGGKTTTLLAFARDKTYERLANPEALLPIYAMIATWDGQMPILDWLAKESGLDAAQMQAEIEAKRALLLLDGLDEQRIEDAATTGAPKRDFRAAFMRATLALPETATLITCRVRDYQDIIAAAGEKASLNGAATLEPLSDAQIQAHLQSVPDLWAALQSDPALLEMARTPLLLTLLTIGYTASTPEQRQQLRDLHASPDELRDRIFEIYIQRRYEFEAAKHPLKYSLLEIQDLLGKLAFVEYRNWRVSIGTISRKKLNELFSSDEADALVTLAIQLHLLIPADDGDFRFVHLLLHDYILYHYCVRQLADSSADMDTKTNYLERIGSFKKRQALTVIIPFLDNPDQRIRVQAIRSLFLMEGTHSGSNRINNFLAVLRGWTDMFEHFGIAQFIDSRILDRILSGQANDGAEIDLQAMKDTTIAEIIRAALTKEYRLVRQYWISKLAEHDDPRVIDLLTPLLNDPDPEIVASARTALEQRGQ
ncbi:MAG: TIR domain-containing protein [Anaerolineae bacterium]|nr:TIR domain-containing protein [Anaerolineae bacterium]